MFCRITNLVAAFIIIAGSIPAAQADPSHDISSATAIIIDGHKSAIAGGRITATITPHAIPAHATSQHIAINAITSHERIASIGQIASIGDIAGGI